MNPKYLILQVDIGPGTQWGDERTIDPIRNIFIPSVENYCKKYNKRNMIPIIDSAVESYLKKYEINRLPEEFLLNSDKKECISKILNDEIENFRNKVY